jgi:hypothetical protein
MVRELEAPKNAIQTAWPDQAYIILRTVVLVKADLMKMREAAVRQRHNRIVVTGADILVRFSSLLYDREVQFLEGSLEQVGIAQQFLPLLLRQRVFCLDRFGGHVSLQVHFETLELPNLYCLY